MTFADRREAGKLLAKKLWEYRGESVVYALPRGGVEVGVEIAKELAVPLDLIISRKIGHPNEPEFAIGAVAESHPVIWSEPEAFLLDPAWRDKAESDERAEVKRRRKAYFAGRKPVSARGKIAIIADDGIATGLTMLAAINELKNRKPKQIIVAAPVAPPDVVATLRHEVDEVITVDDPRNFRGAIGAHYKSFPQLTDKEVIALLSSN